MRFLLNPAKRSARQLGKDKVKVSKHVKSATAPASSSTDNSYTKSWGQQCGPTCGCVVRFETKIDPSTKSIVEASYEAKSVMAIPNSKGGLDPVYTTRSNRPMFTKCKCKTLHTLSKEIVSFLPNNKLDRIRNMAEFNTSRSSPAFRHAVLAENDLSRSDIYCYDVIEEAFLAMIKGSMPHPRKENITYDKIITAQFRERLPEDSEEEARQAWQGGYERSWTRETPSSPRVLSTLRMFDRDAEHWENEARRKVEEDKRPTRRGYDWVSYVDEQKWKMESA